MIQSVRGQQLGIGVRVPFALAGVTYFAGSGGYAVLRRSQEDVPEFHQAIGQYLNYRMVLKRSHPQRLLYLALPTEVYERSFSAEFFQDSLQENRINLILVETISEEISLWLPNPEEASARQPS